MLPRAPLLDTLHCVYRLPPAIRSTHLPKEILFVVHRCDIIKKASIEKFLHEVTELWHFMPKWTSDDKFKCLEEPGK